ncbi:MAG: adenylate/guanylate cyclase domain-containing protein [Bifidobacteriaceae bacterium]|jgi:adenylate cyclase|nr:adenylate/guanylate cyclase domain-containing protein [Bifidobacteriaceae bacterium]
MTDASAPPDNSEPISTVEARARYVAGAAPTLAMRDLLARTGIDYLHIRRMCMALAIPIPEWDDPVFTEVDLEALGWVTNLVDNGVIDGSTEAALLRGISNATERLVWWEFQALVDDAAHRLGLDDFSARIVIIDRITDFASILERQMVYAWRRHLATAIRWLGKRLDEIEPGDSRGRPMPLMRAVGFADLVGYTELSRELNSAGLAALIQDFEATAQDIVTRHGGRVVKAIGDAVMFSTADAASAAAVALDLAERIGRGAVTPPVRVAMVWGGVLERFGDVYGPTVNLASRLAEAAEASQVLTDEATARALAGDRRFLVVPLSPFKAAGIGEVAPFRLTKA